MVDGVDLGAPLTDADVAAIQAALDDRLVLFFEDVSHPMARTNPATGHKARATILGERPV
jgi:alpha-ketoglutarate-dependent taurine dioxygenase